MSNIVPRCVLATALGWSCSALAMTYVMPTDDSLLERSDGVLVGTVIAEPIAAKGGALPRLHYRISVDRLVAGAMNKAEVRLELPGTVVGAERELSIPGLPKLHPGQRVLVFFDETRSGVITPEQLSLGLFMERRSPDGAIAYVREVEGFGADGKQSAHPGVARDAARFERWIRARAAKRAAAVDYMLAPAAASKFTLLQASGGANIRWFQFDSNTSVPWVAVAGGMNGATFDEFAAATSALAAWTSDPGSRILLTYQGTVASDDGNNPGGDSNNAFIWDDPGSDIGGAYDCINGGIVAIGGSFFTVAVEMFNGMPFRRSVEGFVITQNGAECVLNDNAGLDGAETLTHEVGHALGFGHSCEGAGCLPGSMTDDATMRDMAHGDARGANLRNDDKAAAAFVYPDPTAVVDRVFYSGFEI